jgi:hypothetical protein
MPARRSLNGPSAHPIARFKAPHSIQTGVSLAAILNKTAVTLISASFADIYAPFDQKCFNKKANVTIDGRPCPSPPAPLPTPDKIFVWS